MAEGLWSAMARNEREDTSEWTHVDGNRACWPRGPVTGAAKKWDVLHRETRTVYQFETMSQAAAALNTREEDGAVLLDTSGVVHTKPMWYGIRAGRCSKKLLPVLEKLWVRTTRKVQIESTPTKAGIGQ